MDLSGVRVHTDPEAAQISRQLQAVAFTRGQDIYFGTGAYRPESTSGRRLLAHELAHVVQQHRPAATSGPRSVVGRADDPAEREADELAARVVRRSPAASGGTAVQRYTVDRKNTKTNKLLRARYIKVKNPDDAEYYGTEFDTLVESTATIEKMETFVAGLESAKAARQIVVPPTPALPLPGSAPVLDASKPPVPDLSTVPSGVPVLPVPAPSTGPTRKEKPKTTTFTLGPAGYVAKPVPVVDPYAGLSPKLRGLAVQITNWKTNSMEGTAETLSASERDALRAWVESRQTASGKQKYVVNIGPGTGIYTGKNQFKISGFGNVGGKAPTFHITL